ncbi:hypothetical protein MLD38_020538 [Melastoma candidum]|uniref:Uncharacterized protein n=1 Tax=Melastoma candidum TaxID=119954 RepID=A0ACB9QLB8_9MYRT|nr:hypothetical protein MLD38_020538 [Melastoma candidum]
MIAAKMQIMDCGVSGFVRASTKRAREECAHPMSYKGKCLLCNEFVGDDHGMAFEYLLPDLRITEFHADFIRRMHTNKTVKAGKLHLVLDLDNTLLHTVRLDEMAGAIMLGHGDLLANGRDLVLINNEFLTKLRPFLREFLKEASTMFEMTVYTMGGCVYGSIMVELIDPDRSYFSDRVITREDCTTRGRKSLDVVLAEESNVIIIDDRRDVWPEHGVNLIQIKPYHYLSEDGTMMEERAVDDDNDWALLDILERLRDIHRAYFSPESEIEGIKDVRTLLKLIGD